MHNFVSTTNITNCLIHTGLLSPQDAAHFHTVAQKQNIPLISYLVTHKILNSETLLKSCADYFNLPTTNLNPETEIDTTLLNIDLIQKHRILPLRKINDILEIALSDPTEKNTLEIIRFHSECNLQLKLVDEEQLEKFLQKLISDQIPTLPLHLLNELTNEDVNNLLNDNVVNYDEPLIKFLDNLILHATRLSASDIHIEPFETICRIRYRQDGILHNVAEVANHVATRLVTRLKVISKLDITERRQPQDGRFHLHKTDVRISSCPTLFGEKIVLRLLNNNKNILDIHKLGFSKDQATLFIKKISQPQGLILVTGPTGSGKTTTLYSALNYLNIPEKSISTVEDPIEIQLEGINQVAINTRINFTFTTALRSFLRQDPDILMVGEIRDKETAEIALQAAQTGHLVLSTLHTNNTIETLIRLQAMGIPSHQIIHSLTLIVAQRLLRRLCQHCKQPEENPVSLKNLKLTKQTFKPAGCNQCLKGYNGRIAIYECLPITDSIASLMLAKADHISIATEAKRQDFLSLHDIGLKHVIGGITSFSELNRVINLCSN